MKGIYALCLNIEKDICVKVGALGYIALEKGGYVYVGSALNSMEPRLLRHIRKSMGNVGKLHWHIDYLLINRAVRIANIFIKETLEKEECSLAEHVGLHGVSVSGFGSSDCRCEGHLFSVDDFGFLEGFGLVEWSNGVDLIS